MATIPSHQIGFGVLGEIWERESLNIEQASKQDKGFVVRIVQLGKEKDAGAVAYRRSVVGKNKTPIMIQCRQRAGAEWLPRIYCGDDRWNVQGASIGLLEGKIDPSSSLLCLSESLH